MLEENLALMEERIFQKGIARGEVRGEARGIRMILQDLLQSRFGLLPENLLTLLKSISDIYLANSLSDFTKMVQKTVSDIHPSL